MKIWVDADACPGELKDLIGKAAERVGVQSYFVANRYMNQRPSQFVFVVQVAHGDDVADQYIVDNAQPNDLVVTQDIPLAALLVPRRVHVLGLKGELFTEENIGERLSIRDFNTELRGSGVRTGGPRPFSAQQKQQFAGAFDAILTKALRIEKQQPAASPKPDPEV